MAIPQERRVTKQSQHALNLHENQVITDPAVSPYYDLVVVNVGAMRLFAR